MKNYKYLVETMQPEEREEKEQVEIKWNAWV